MFPLLLLASLPLLTVALLIDHPVASQRIVMITPALSMIIAWGIWVVSGRLLKAKWGWVLAVFLVVECMLIDSWIYFIRYTPERTYGGINGVVASELVRLKTAPAETRVVFFGPGRMWYHSFSNVAFEMPHLIGVNVEEGEVYEHLEEGTLYVALPERVEELASVVAQDIREENVLVVWFEQPVSLRERLAFYTDEDRGVRIGEMSRLETEMGVEGGTVLFYVYDPERRWVF